MAMPVAMPPHGAALGRRWALPDVRRLIAETPLASPRYELVEGELLVTPSPAGLHQRASRLLLTALAEYVERERVGEAFHSPFDVELEPESLVQPDIFVVPPHEARRLTTEMPARELLLAVEIVSPSSSRFDRVVKRPLYQRHVLEYWIVDLDARLIERWRPSDERPEILVDVLEWNPSGATATFRLELPPFFAKVYGEAG